MLIIVLPRRVAVRGWGLYGRLARLVGVALAPLLVGLALTGRRPVLDSGPVVPPLGPPAWLGPADVALVALPPVLVGLFS